MNEKKIERPPLRRLKQNRIFGGVCSGLAEHLHLPVLWVRVAVTILVFAGGAGIIFYVFLYLTVPKEGENPAEIPLRRVFTPPAEAAEKTQETIRRLPMAEILLGGSFLVAGVALIAVQLGVQLQINVILPALAVLVGVGLTWWLIADRETPGKNILPRVLGALALVAVGVLMFFITADEPDVITVIGAAIAVLAGVTLAIAPWLLQLNRELSSEKAARARESERAEIAAHLHDSVLQTLALIQQKSSPESEVARLARSQERELRDWLFKTADQTASTDEKPQHQTAYEKLKTHANDLEKDYAARFEVVAVGERAHAPEAIIAASKEAMLNAAKHAGGDIFVYIETTPEEIMVNVNDRGPGFNHTKIMSSRFGVKESILGRMERQGGTAKITTGPGGVGVSVRLKQNRADATHNKN